MAVDDVFDVEEPPLVGRCARRHTKNHFVGDGEIKLRDQMDCVRDLLGMQRSETRKFTLIR